MTAVAEPGKTALDEEMRDADPGAGEDRYAGLATRVVAFLIDAGIIDVVAIVVAAAAALIVSFFHVGSIVQTILKFIGLGLYVLWAAGYFVGFWTATGQTPGNRLMQIRVLTAAGPLLKPRGAIVRCVGLVLAALPLFLGYAGILFDGRRRGFADRLARTVVVYAPGLSYAQAARVKRRAVEEASRAASQVDAAGVGSGA
jgi:uncharacterized RDD family membrane protein YckC